MIPRPAHALAAALLLAVEAAIAAFVDDGFVRPYLGDALAVVLVHAVIRAVAPIGPRAAAACAFVVACAIEASQAVHLVDRIGLGDSPVARAVLGTGFDPHDIVAYAAGALAAAAFDRVR